ncbi:MAG TPA: methyltransferase domain-containing protein [Actinomycetota bacterium]|nr:methyltransferase domain-containing protein [Actinomycetota bacterium]
MADIRDQIREFWDHDAETYDQSPSHALTDPVEAAAWRALLRRHLPPPPAHVLDAGAGTGAITALLLDLGYRATALDISSAMLDRARTKLAGRDVEFVVAPADEPPPGPFDAVVERHVLWTNPDPVRTLAAWREVAPEGRLVAMEGLGPSTIERRVRFAFASLVRRVLDVPHDHHDHYGEDVVRALPLLHARTPAPLLGAARRAGWKGRRVERLRDVEWARRMIAPTLISRLESTPLFAVVADA